MSTPETPDPVAQALADEDAAALQTLAASGEKSIRKAAKRALYLLRSRGIDVPDTAESAPSKAVSPGAGAEEAREPIWATAYDGDGNRGIFLPRKAKLGFTLDVLVLSDATGIANVATEQLSRKQLRATLADLSAESRAVLREISPARAAAMIAEALALGPESAYAARARELLRGLPPPEAATSRSADEASLRDSAKLFETVPLRTYLPPRETLLQVSQQLEEVVVSPLLVDEPQRLAQLRHALERATSEFFTSERRGRYASRLQDASEFFEGRGEAASAAQARAAAEALRGDRPIHEIPFARALFERIFDLEAALKAMAPERPHSPEPASPGKPGGGLILP